MCGVVGWIGRELGSNAWGNALHSIDHRGPDGTGSDTIFLYGKCVHLGHTRLAILDLSEAGHQPMSSSDGRWRLVFNGEIYNHLALREQLSVPFRGHSDTETLVECLAKFGIDHTLPLLNGMFAFAALDTISGILYLVRDPFGVKPLYFAQRGGNFAFASEVRALRAMGITPAVDPAAASTFLSLRYVPSPNTLWKGVSRLQPGHVLSYFIEDGKVYVSHYVRPVQNKFQGSRDDAIVAYHDQLSKAVERQLLSDVPVGILLSGGIDSALIAAMAKEAGHVLPCYTVGFGEAHKECEIEDASETADVLGFPFASINVDQNILLDSLPEIVSSVEEPLGTTSILPMWHLVKRARKDVTVVLTGQGTDEPWGGYRRYQSEVLRDYVPWGAAWSGLKLARSLWKSPPEFIERGMRTLPVDNMPRRFLEAYALFPPNELSSVIRKPDLNGATASIEYWLDWMKDANLKPVEKMMRVDTRMNLADDLLLYGDKISMAASLEARVPMLDIELIRFVESLPVDYRVGLNQGKIVHKLMAERYLPSQIVYRKKKGFQVPFDTWSRGAWKPWIESVLFAPDAPHWQLLHKDGVQRCWQEHLSGKPGRGRQMFSLIMLCVWWRQQEGMM